VSSIALSSATRSISLCDMWTCEYVSLFQWVARSAKDTY
jgi:hypothetical protein